MMAPTELADSVAKKIPKISVLIGLHVLTFDTLAAPRVSIMRRKLPPAKATEPARFHSAHVELK